MWAATRPLDSHATTAVLAYPWGDASGTVRYCAVQHCTSLSTFDIQQPSHYIPFRETKCKNRPLSILISNPDFVSVLSTKQPLRLLPFPSTSSIFTVPYSAAELQPPFWYVLNNCTVQPLLFRVVAICYQQLYLLHYCFRPVLCNSRAIASLATVSIILRLFFSNRLVRTWSRSPIAFF